MRAEREAEEARKKYEGDRRRRMVKDEELRRQRQEETRRREEEALRREEETRKRQEEAARRRQEKEAAQRQKEAAEPPAVGEADQPGDYDVPSQPQIGEREYIPTSSNCTARIIQSSYRNHRNSSQYRACTPEASVTSSDAWPPRQGGARTKPQP